MSGKVQYIIRVLYLLQIVVYLFSIGAYSQEADSTDQISRNEVKSLVEKIPLSQDTLEQLRMGWVYLQIGALPHSIYRGVILGNESGLFGTNSINGSNVIVPTVYGISSALAINWIFRSKDVWPAAANMYVSNATMSHMHGIFAADGIFKNRIREPNLKWYPITVFGVSWAESWGSYYAAKALKMSYADNLSWVFGNIWGTYWGYQFSPGRFGGNSTEPNLYFRKPLIGASIGIVLSQITQKVFPRTTGDWRAIHAASLAVGLYTHLQINSRPMQSQRPNEQIASFIGHLAGMTGAYIFTSQAKLTDFEGLIFYGGTGLGMLIGFARFGSIEPPTSPSSNSLRAAGTGGIIGFGLSYLVVKTLRTPITRVKRPSYGSWDIQMDPSGLIAAALPASNIDTPWIHAMNPGFIKVTWYNSTRKIKSNTEVTSTISYF
jgi:hypothetical protein